MLSGSPECQVQVMSEEGMEIKPSKLEYKGRHTRLA